MVAKKATSVGFCRHGSRDLNESVSDFREPKGWPTVSQTRGVRAQMNLKSKKPGSREKKPGFVRLEGLEPPTF